MRFFKWFRGIFARRHGSCNRDARRKYRYCDNDPQPLAPNNYPAIVESALGDYFSYVTCRRINAAVLKVVVVDDCFAGLGRAGRCDVVDNYIDKLPTPIQIQIVKLACLTPDEYRETAEE